VIWDSKTGQLRRTIDYADAPNVGWTNGNEIMAVRFDASGKRLITTGTDHRAVVWHCETGLPLHILRGHESFVYSACFGYVHTNWVVTCSFDRTARVWDLQNEQFVIERTLSRVEHEDDGVQDVQFSPDDRMFVTGGLDSTVRFWESQTGRLVPPILQHHERVLQVKWSPDAKRLIAVMSDRSAQVWNLGPQKPLTQVMSSDFTSDGRFRINYDPSGVRLTDLTAGRDLVIPKFQFSNVLALSFAGGSNNFLSLSSTPGVASPGASQLQLWSFAKKTPASSPLVYDPSWSRWECSPDGHRFALFEDVKPPSTNGVLLWEPERGPATRRIAFPDEVVDCVAFEPTGRRLAIGCRVLKTNSGVLHMIDLDGNEKTAVLLNCTQWFGHVTFSRDGQWLAAACWDNSLDPGDAMIWQVPEPGRAFGKPIPLRHTDGVLYVAFSDTGEMVATASEDHTANVWCRTNSTWQLCLRPLPCGGEVYACSFSHNGRWLATAHRTLESQHKGKWSSEIRIWDITTGRPISLPFAVPEKVTRLGFVAGDTQLFFERRVPGAPAQRWLIDLGVDKGSATEFLLRAELLSGRLSFLSGVTEYPGRAREGSLSPDEALLHATSVGPRLRLSKDQCRELWRQFSSGATPYP
jgi:WD40 repeat protein